MNLLEWLFGKKKVEKPTLPKIQTFGHISKYQHDSRYYENCNDKKQLKDYAQSLELLITTNTFNDNDSYSQSNLDDSKGFEGGFGGGSFSGGGASGSWSDDFLSSSYSSNDSSSSYDSGSSYDSSSSSSDF